MSRFKKLSQTIWHYQYYIVWTPKYRFKILKGKVKAEIENCIRTFSVQQGAEIIELNAQINDVYLLVMIPPKVSVSGFVGPVTGRTAIRVLNRFAVISKPAIKGKETIDSKGLVVAPGFIDGHQHCIEPCAYRLMLRDGRTTIMDLELGAHGPKLNE
ncbi:MAG: IS200/IS605 family transposase [Desulfatibacillum sp.]|nr:IS200/IS605 family transposase [Desulfatibacillum sp.]